jgi:ubiquinone biosynthesis monooxygenase Coq7
MSNSPRQLTATDHFLSRLCDGLRARNPQPQRAAPQAAKGADPGADLSEPERRHAAALMRVNHAGEVAAQGLYHGQALFAREADVRRHLIEAAAEEQEHLRWCEQRLQELGDGPSKLRPLWYVGSFAIGALAGLAGDQKSLGFVAETERQVSAHLGEHLAQLPAADNASRAVILQMQADENRHGEQALAAGGATPPLPVRALMRAVAGVMKATAARI